MSDPSELSALRDENRRLWRLLEEAEAAARALMSGEVDSALDVPTATPLLLADAQAALRANEQQFRAVFDGALDGLVVLDDAGVWVEANAAACLVLGRRRSEVVGRAPAELSFDSGALARLKRNGRLRGAQRLPRPDGALRVVEYVATADFLPGRHLLVLRDTTARVQAETALRESEERHRELFESNPHPILVHDPESRRILAVNRAAVEQYGWSREEFLGLAEDEIRPPGEPIAASERRVSDAGAGSPATHVGEWRHRRKDGSLFWARVFEQSVQWTSGPALLTVVTDVSQRREAEEKLQHAQRLEAVGRLAGGLAHDFNNLLGVILGYSEVLLGRTEGVTAGDRRRLAAVRQAAQRGAALTRQLLAFSRHQVLVPRPVRLSEVVEGMLELLGRLLGEDVRLETSLPAEGTWVLVDRGQMEQVVMNLAVNARDAMPGGGRLWIRVRDVSGAEGPRAVLEVRDEGVGMDAETRNRVFEPFFTTKPPEKGTGLGLATVFGIVTQSGGTIDLESEPGQGTIVTLSLPHADPPAEAEEEVAAAPTRAPGAGRPRILLVEDEDSLREVAREILESLGCDVVEAESAATALERAPGPEAPADLLITDVVLPGLDGRQLAEQLLAEDRVRRILYTSGYTDDHVIARGVAPGAASFLQKPYSVADLEAEVSRLVGGLER